MAFESQKRNLEGADCCMKSMGKIGQKVVLGEGADPVRVRQLRTGILRYVKKEEAGKPLVNNPSPTPKLVHKRGKRSGWMLGVRLNEVRLRLRRLLGLLRYPGVSTSTRATQKRSSQPTARQKLHTPVLQHKNKNDGKEHRDRKHKSSKTRRGKKREVKKMKTLQEKENFIS